MKRTTYLQDRHSDLADEKPTLMDLISLEDLQQLQDTLADMHQVTSVITDLDGNLLTIPSNDLFLCRLINHSSKGLRHCTEESTPPIHMHGEGALQVCRMCERMGIVKELIPISVGESHSANWWLSRYCGQPISDDQLSAIAEEFGVSFDMLFDQFKKLPIGQLNHFKKVVEWTKIFINQIIRLLYENKQLSRHLAKMSLVETELDEHRSQMEEQIKNRTSDLIKANNRLQLEALERDLAEEQKARKAKLLNAINHIFQQALNNQSDKSLAKLFLTSVRKLTNSPFGFIAEKRLGQWRVSAIHHPHGSEETASEAISPKVSEISKIWRQMITQGTSLSMPGIDEDLQLTPLPKTFPDLKSFLAVPLCKDHRISGFIAVADKHEGYALVDQNDMEALSQAFIETLLRKRVEAEKVKSERRLNLALESSNEGLWDYSHASGQIYYSPRWFAMLGYDPEEFPESLETWTTLIHPDDLSDFEDIFQSLVDGLKVAFNTEIRMLSRSGKWRWFQARGRTVSTNGEGKAKRIIGTLIDISKYKRVEVALQKANDELQRLAALDDLTQIANRRRFDDRMAQEWRRGQRDNTSLAVIICDIDYFKEYNDTYGHLKGDETLYSVAQAISAALKRPMDLVARFGGEEFAMVLPNTDIIGAERVAKEVELAISGLAIKHRSSHVSEYITLSFGVAAICPTPELSVKVLIEAADKALYSAKSSGRHQICCVSPPSLP